MLTKLKIYNLAYAELLRRREVEARRPNGPLKYNIMIRYDDEIDELHELILTEESKLQEHKTTEAN